MKSKLFWLVKSDLLQLLATVNNIAGDVLVESVNPFKDTRAKVHEV